MYYKNISNATKQYDDVVVKPGDVVELDFYLQDSEMLQVSSLPVPAAKPKSTTKTTKSAKVAETTTTKEDTVDG